MKRRHFGAMLATATLSLGGIGSVSADASAQSTEPLEIEDVSVSVGGVTNSIGIARFVYEDGTMGFGVQDWTMESDDQSLSVGSAVVAATDVSEETYATLREGMVESFDGRTLTPLLVAFQEADMNPESEVQMVHESIELNGSLVADQVTASGVAGSVVPDGTSALLDDGPTLRELAALGSSEWDSLTIQRGDGELTANDVAVELDGAAVAITAPSGSATVSDRSFEFTEMGMVITPPGTIPEEHIEFASEVRESGSEGDLSLSTIVSAAEESGVTADNTAETVRNAQFELSFAEITEEGETVVSNFSTSGTLAELLSVLRQRASTGRMEDDEAEEGLPKVAVVSSPGTDELMEYTFGVTGRVEHLEPDEDSGDAADEITQVNGRYRVDGAVSTGDDRFAFSGDLVEIDVPDAVEIDVSQR